MYIPLEYRNFSFAIAYDAIAHSSVVSTVTIAATPKLFSTQRTTCGRPVRTSV